VNLKGAPALVTELLPAEQSNRGAGHKVRNVNLVQLIAKPDAAYSVAYNNSEARTKRHQAWVTAELKQGT